MEHFRIHRADLAIGAPMTDRSSFNTTTAYTQPTKARLWIVPSWESARHSLAQAVAGTPLKPQPRPHLPQSGSRRIVFPVSHTSNPECQINRFDRLEGKARRQWQPKNC